MKTILIKSLLLNWPYPRSHTTMGPFISHGLLVYHTLYIHEVSWNSEAVTFKVWLISYGMTHRQCYDAIEAVKNGRSIRSAV